MSEFDEPDNQPNTYPRRQGDNHVQPPRHPRITPSDDQVDASWHAVFEQALPGLRNFLHNRLTQESDIDDCLQTVSVRMIEKGSKVAPASRRAWLFQVAANEAAGLWRRRAVAKKAMQHYAESETNIDLPIDSVAAAETSKQILDALRALPPEWQKVVQLRINQNRTFQQIADQLDIPLGTALTQMRRALERMKRELDSDT